MQKFFGFFIVVILLLALPAASSAMWYWGTKPLGMGTAGVAVADDNNAIQMNPAGVAETRFGSLDVQFERREYEIYDYPQLHEDDIKEEEDDWLPGYERTNWYDDEETDPHEKNISDFWHASIIDGKTSKAVSAGVSFTAANFPNRTFQEGKDYRAAVALAGNSGDIFYLGLAGKYISFEPGDSNFNMDAGFIVRAIDYFSVGVVGRNVFGSSDPYKAEREVAGGVAVHVLDYATVAFDATKVFDVEEPNTFNFALGAEGWVYKTVRQKAGLAIRGGFDWNQIYDRDYYAFGIGWNSAEGGLGYTFRGDVERTRNFQHSISLTLRF